MDLQKTHPIVQTESFPTVEAFVLYLIHRKAYEYAAELANGKRLLDWGCNDGYGMEVMRPFVSELSGLDSAEHCVLAARRRLPNIASNISLYNGIRLPFPAESFDVVTSFQVIEHLLETEIYLSHILNVLAPGGIAIFTTPNKRLRLDPGDEPWNTYHVREFTAIELQELLALRFSRVQMLGLRGTSDLEAVERNRCQVAKQGVKRQNSRYWKLRKAFFTRAKRVIPHPMESQLRTLLRLRRPRQDSLYRFTTNDLHYSDIDVDDSLDLMAICTK